MHRGLLHVPGQLLLLTALLVALAGCVVARPWGTQVSLRSGDATFIAPILAGAATPPRSVSGILLEPGPEWRAPHPAVVLLHTSYGQGSHDWWYARRLRDAGYTVLAIDSFSSRGVMRLVDDQTAVPSTSMLLDAYAALDLLGRRPGIDPRRIAVMGFSKGAIAALYASLERIRAHLAPDGNRFAVHIAYYPWCGLHLRNPVTTGAPVRINVGADDVVTPAAPCRAFAAALGRAGSTGVSVRVFEGAGHAFDHPLLPILGSIRANGFATGDCTIREQDDGSFVIAGHGIVVSDRDSLRAGFRACGGPDVIAVANRAVAERAWRESLALLNAELRPARLRARAPAATTVAGHR